MGPDPSETLIQGIRLCRSGEWREGLAQLRLLTPGRNGSLPGIYFSYLGLAIARCDGDKRDGLRLCRHGVSEQPFEPDNHMNLAKCYLLLRKRRPAVLALQRGLALNPSHRGLVQLARRMGVRSRPPLPFLDRSHPLNRTFGRLRYRAAVRRAERRRAREDA